MHQVDAARAAATKLKVGAVQGNIPFDLKGINRRDLAHSQLEDLQAESAKLEREGAELLLWTESSYPYHVPRDQPGDFPEESEGRIRRGFHVPLILGAVTLDPAHLDKPPYNSALMLDPDGQFRGRFDKIFLLVFGEYIPFYDSLPFIRKMMPSTAGQFSRGSEVVTFPLRKDGVEYRLAPLICYEDILADFGRRLAALHPHLLVNITNDAWFGETSEPWEHLALSVYRAVELRVDLVRAVNTGVSAFVDANGRVFAKTYAVDPKVHPRGVDGIVAEVALVEGGHTVYAVVGNLFGYLCVAATGFLWLVWPRLRRRARPAKTTA
jgi:apolipoprotein N-acyltransferase